jgi:hypothetical protein
MHIAWTSLIEDLLPRWPELDAAERERVAADCQHFVTRHIGMAPPYVRLGVVGLMTAFWAYAGLRRATGARDGLAAMLDGFCRLPIPMVANLDRLLRTSAMIGYLDHPMVLAKLGEERPDEHQARFRQLRAAVEAR